MILTSITGPFLMSAMPNCRPLNSFLKGKSCIADDGRNVRYGIRRQVRIRRPAHALVAQDQAVLWRTGGC